MIYLKKFNESNSTKKDEILKFCEENLGYLTDAGFGILISERQDELNIVFDHQTSKLFKWEDIMDDFVPFLELFDMKFGLKKLKPSSKRDKFSKKCVVIINTKFNGYRYRLEDLVNNEVSGILGALTVTGAFSNGLQIESIDFYTEK